MSIEAKPQLPTKEQKFAAWEKEYRDTLFFYARLLDEHGVDFRLQMTDTGNAERLIRNYGDDLSFAFENDSWYYHDGRRWRPDSGGRIQELAIKSALTIQGEAVSAIDDEQAKQIYRWYKNSQSASKIKAAIELARSNRKVAIQLSDFDRTPYLLNCKNGVVDLRSGEIRPHDRADLITKLVPVNYDPDAACPTWLAFLNKVFGGNQRLIAFMQRLVGYAATGATIEQVLAVLYGSGRNGKSTFLTIIAAILGDYSRNASVDTFLVKRGNDSAPREDLARLAGSRYVTAIEVSEGRRLDEALVKSITGGDAITCRNLYSASFEYIPMFTVFMGVNHKPLISGSDIGIWRRVRVIPFTVQIPKEEVDKNLKAKLQGEREGILAWLVQGARDWYADGLQEPEEVLLATSEYQADMDIIQHFIDEGCEVIAGARVSSSSLYSSYSFWAKSHGYSALNERNFKARLLEKGFAHKHTNKGNVYEGIAGRDDFRTGRYAQALDAGADAGTGPSLWGEAGESKVKIN